MRMTVLPLSVLCLTTMTAIVADDATPDAKAKPKAESVVTVAGIFEAVQASEVSADTEKLSALIISKIVPHGTTVKQGQTVAWFKTDDIDKKIKAAETTLRLSKLTHDEEEFAHQQFIKTQKLDQAVADRTRKAAQQTYDNYIQTDRDRSIASAHFSLKSSEASLQNALEELKQLEQMYKEDDLTEESEEIVLKRAKQAADSARFRHEGTVPQVQRTLKNSIPAQAAAQEDAYARAQMAYQKTVRSLQSVRQRAEIEIDRKRDKLKEEEKALAEMKAERGKLVVKAPHDGIVYHGSLTRGKLSDKPSPLKSGSAVTGKQVLATIVNPARLQIRADLSEAQRAKVSVGMQGSVTANVSNGKKQTARVVSVADVPYANNKFDAVLAVKGDVKGLVPGTGCTVKLNTTDR